MTQLEVIKAFMARLANHGYSVSNATATNMLNSAVVASSRFTSINEVIQSMKANQADCEANAIYNVVTTVLGANWYLTNCVNYLTDENGNSVLDEKGQKQIASFKTLSEIETLLSTAKKADNSDVTYDDVKDFTAAQSYTSLSNVIKEVTANYFLKNCCGIQLNKNYYISGSTILPAGNSDNTDTGAITGSDANIVYHKEDFTEEKWEKAKTIFPQDYDAVLSKDETTLTIGTGTTKTAEDIVPETWLNTYIATTNQAQNITTGNRDWVVKATAANDTIISGGADSINAGAGDDEINITGNGATVTSGAGEDTIEISADVKKVTITDLNADDTLTIAGSFEVGAAKIEDMMLVITDKTGTRKITLGDLETAKGGKINLDGASTTIAKWLTDSGINLGNLEKTTYAASVGVTPATSETSTATEAAVTTHDVSGTVEVNLKDYLTANEGDVEKSGETVGTLSSSFPNASTFTRNGLTVHLLGISSTSSPENITAKNFSDLTADQKAIVAALFKWWGSETLKLNEESYGISFTSDNAKVTDIGLYFYSASSNTLAAVWNWQRKSDDGEAYQLMLNVNMNYYNGLSSNTYNDAVMNGKSNVTGAAYLDRTLAHEMTHAVMAANVNYFNNLPKFIKEGIAELTHGIDDERGDIIFKNAYDAEQLEASLDMTNTGTGSQEIGDAYAGGYMFMRYFAYQSALQTLAMPAYGEITVDVDLGNLGTLVEGNVLYVDTTETNPTVQVATNMDAYKETDAQNHYNLLNLGIIGADGSGDLYYYVESDWIKQNITTSADIHDVYGVNANITVTGTGDYDGVQIVDGNTEVNTGDGADFISAAGQYATINTGADNDIVNINEGSHHNINLGEGDNQLLIQGIPSVIITSEGAVSYLNTSSNYGHIITGGAGADTVTNGISVYYLSAKNNDGTYGAYNVADDYIFYIDGSTLVQVTDGSYFDQNKKYYAATGFDENSNININESIEVTPYNFYQYNYEYQMDLGDGDNVVKLSTFENSSLTTGAGNDIIAFTGSDETSNKISSGAGNDSVIFGSLNDNNALNSYTKLNKNYVDLGAGNDTITFGGSYNSIIGGKGNDQITKANDDGDNNVYIYNSDFGADQISGFTSNDSICIADGYTAEASAVSSGKVTVTVKSGNTEKGTINITLASGATFNADTNIYKGVTAFENIEYTVTATGRTIKLNGDVSDVIYIDATKFTAPAEGTEYGTLTLSGTFGEDDKIIVYVGNKNTNPDTCTVTQDGKSALINVTHNNTKYAIKVENAFKESITLCDTVSENHTLDGTYTKTGIASNETNAYILEYKTETKDLTLSGVSIAENISADGATISVNTSSIYTDGDAKGEVKLTTEANITLAVTGEDLGELSAGWTLNEENKVATYSDVSKKGYIVDDKQIKYNADEHDKKLTISGIASTEDLTLEGTELTIKAANIGENKTIEIKENTGGYSVNLSNDISNVTVNGSTGNDTISNSGATVTIDGGAGDDEIANSGANVSIIGGAGDDKVTISGNNATINVADGNDSITFSSAVTAMTVENFGVGDVLISETDFEMDNVTDTSDGIKIGNATIHGVTKSIVDENWKAVSGGFEYTAEATTLQKNSDNAKQISYTSSSKNFTISGLKDDVTTEQIKKAVSVSGTTVTINDSAILPLSGEVTISDGYTLALGENMSNKSTLAAENYYQATSEKFSYSSAGYTAGYRVDNKKIIYQEKTIKEFEISNLSATAVLGTDIAVTGTEIKIKQSALAEKNATLTTSDGYTLTLDGVSAATTTNAGWDKLTYKSSYVSAAGYAVDEEKTKIKYTATTTATDLFKLDGVTTANGFTVSTTDDQAYTVKVDDSAVTGLNAETTITLTEPATGITATFDGTALSGKTEKTVDAAASLVNGKYTSASYFAYTNINDKTLTYYPATTAKEFTISNLSAAAKLGENVTVTDGETTKFEFKAAALDKKDIAITSDSKFTVALDSDVDTVAEEITADKTITKGVLNYTAAGTGEFYKATANGVTYTSATKRPQFKLSGVKSAESVTVSGNTVTVTDAAFDMTAATSYTVKFENVGTADFALTFNANTNSSAISAKLDNGTYTSAHNSAYFTGSGNEYTFNPAVGAKTFTISGLKDGAALNKDLTVTEDATSTEFKFKASALNKENVAITTSNGGAFTVALDSDVTTTGETISENKAISDGVLTYTAAGTGEFYTKTNTGVNYTSATERPQFTLSGVKNADGVTVSGNTVTVTDAAFDMTAATSYTVKFENVGTANFALTFNANKNSSAIAAKLDNGTYTSAQNNAYFTGSGNEYTFNPAVGAKTFTISNLSAAAKLGENVTVTDGETTKFEFKAAALNKQNIEISGGTFEVVLNGDVDTVAEEITADKTITKGVLNYTAAGTGEFYKATANGVTYTAQVGGEQFKISGLNTSATSADGIEITKQNDGTFKIVFSDKNLLDKKSPTITTDETYTLEVATTIEPTVQNPAWKITGAAATLAAATSEGYKVSNNKIVYFAESPGASLFEISGLVANAELTAPVADATTLTIDAAQLGNNAIIRGNAGNYSVQVTGDMTGKIFTGTSDADIIEVNAKNALVKANSGDDQINITGANVTVIGGKGDDQVTLGNGADKAVISFDSVSGNDIVTGFSANTSLQLTIGRDSYTTETSEDGNDVTIKVGESTLTLKDAKNIFNAKSNIDTVYGEAPNGFSIRKDTLTAAASVTGTVDLADYPTSITKINAAAVTGKVTLVGNDLANLITGGKESDSIFGGAGNDKLYGENGDDTLSGGEGNDTLYGGDGKNIFVYTGGNDYIADYTAGSDSIQMDFTNVKSQVSGSNVILTIYENNTVTIKGAKDKEVTFVNDAGESDTKIFFAETYYAPLEDGLKYDSKRVSLTAGSNFGGDEINLSNYLDTVAKVNASAVTKAFKITGKENQSYSILGGKGNDVITLGNGKNSVRGGNGADNITGGTGNDILKGEVGNDTLSGGTGNDTLTGGDGADVFIYGGGNDLITDYTAEDKINAAFKISKVSGSNVILTAEDGGTLTIKGAKNKTVTFVDDAGKTKDQWIFYNDTYYAPLADGLTYNNSKTQLTASSIFGGEINLPETYLSTVTKVNASAVKTALTITGNTNNNSISGGAGNDIISGGDSGKNTIRGGAGADSIKVSGENANKLYGDAGNDTLIGGDGNDTMYGGADNDSINGGNGNNKLYGDAGNDTLIGGTGNDTMYGGDGNDSIDGGNGNNKLYGNAGNDTILGGTGKDTLYGGAGADSINGGDGDDKILGEAGDDTLVGGAGNDTFTGGAGTDVFVYEGGKDLITDYTAGEEIQLSGSYKVTEKNYSYSGKNLTFTFDNDNTLTIKNAKNKTITINGDSKVYEVQKVHAQTYDLLYDNNFATDEFGLDDITEAKFEVTNIETQNNTEIAQDDKTLITYTDK